MSDFYLLTVRRLSAWAWVTAQALTALAIVICCGNALSRKFLDLSSNAMLEAQWYCFGAAFLLAGSQVLADNAHVRVDVLASRLTERARLRIDLAGLLLCLVPFCVLMAVWSWPMFTEAWLRNEMSADAGGLLRWPIKLMIPIGFLLLGMQGIAQSLLSLQRLRGLDTGSMRSVDPGGRP